MSCDLFQGNILTSLEKEGSVFPPDMNTKTRKAESRRIWLEVMHDAMVEPLLVPDGEVLRVLHDRQGEADKARGNQQLLVCPARWLKDSDVAIPWVFMKKTG